MVLAGGTEACMDRLSVAGFCRLRALSTNFNDDPAHNVLDCTHYKGHSPAHAIALRAIVCAVGRTCVAAQSVL